VPFGEQHPFIERGSPARLSASGQQSYTGYGAAEDDVKVFGQ